MLFFKPRFMRGFFVAASKNSDLAFSLNLEWF